MTPEQLQATMGKTQTIRVLDVVLIGPLMIWGGVALAERNVLAGGLLGLFGVLTVWYNGRNWLRYDEQRAAIERLCR